MAPSWLIIASMYRGKMWWRGGRTCEGAERRSPQGVEERGEEEGERDGSDGTGRRVAESNDCCCCCWLREVGDWYMREKEEGAAVERAHKIGRSKGE